MQRHPLATARNGQVRGNIVHFYLNGYFYAAVDARRLGVIYRITTIDEHGKVTGLHSKIDTRR
jgi:hypothetical protein